MSIYALSAEFDHFLERGKGTRRAIVYDQFNGGIERCIEGTRQEILAQYIFYRECYPDRSLGLVSEAYYQAIKKQSK